MICITELQGRALSGLGTVMMPDSLAMAPDQNRSDPTL
jgi:hypothetical protein